VWHVAGPTRIWEAGLDGSAPHPVLPGWDAFGGCWTPDGRYFVFAARRDDETIGPPNGFTPDWSADGDRLVFGHWIGRAPDDAPIALREKGDAPEVYALEVDWP